MPGTTVAEDVEIIIEDIGGGGGGKEPPAGGDGGGDGDKRRRPSRPSPNRYSTAIILGIVSILMFFMALTSAYIVRKDIPNSGWHPLTVPRILWLNTAVLIASSFTLARARKLFKANDQRGFRHWWGVTTILGAFFLLGQIIAWQQLRAAGLFLATNPSSSFFYVFTAAHGLHLLGGVLALTYILFRPTHRLTKGTASEVGAMYWHFMDGLWVFLFLLFLLGR